MSDLHGPLDREARRVRGTDDALESVRRRLERRRRTRRVAAGALALAIGGSGLALAYTAFRPGAEGGPSAAPTAGPTGSPIPGPTTTGVPLPGPTPTGHEPLRLVGVEVTITDGAHVEDLWELAKLIVESGGYGPRHGGYVVTNDRLESVPSDVTYLDCAPELAHEARRLRELFFPDAQIRAGLPPGNTRVHISLGRDFSEAHAADLAAFDVLEAFMDRRVAGSGAERHLYETAATAYQQGEGGLDLYAYARSQPYAVTAWSARGRRLVVVRIGSGLDAAWETLGLMNPFPCFDYCRDPHGTMMIVSAERDA